MVILSLQSLNTFMTFFFITVSVSGHDKPFNISCKVDLVAVKYSYWLIYIPLCY